MQVIVSPQEDIYIAVRPGAKSGMQLPAANYAELVEAAEIGSPVPTWFADAAHQAWHGPVVVTFRPV